MPALPRACKASKGLRAHEARGSATASWCLRQDIRVDRAVWQGHLDTGWCRAAPWPPPTRCQQPLQPRSPPELSRVPRGRITPTVEGHSLVAALRLRLPGIISVCVWVCVVYVRCFSSILPHCCFSFLMKASSGEGWGTRPFSSSPGFRVDTPSGGFRLQGPPAWSGWS